MESLVVLFLYLIYYQRSLKYNLFALYVKVAKLLWPMPEFEGFAATDLSRANG